MDEMSKKISLIEKIKEEVLHLKESPLFEYRNMNSYVPVIGEGSLGASIMFIGEAPGKKEAITAKPFCGASGKILDNLLESISLLRKDVYITSVVNDRPQENRDPTPEEVALYGPFLIRQIEVIQPKVIATLGRISMAYLFEYLGLTKQLDTIGKIHGQVFEGMTSYGKVVIVPLYHPAASIYNQKLKETLKEDFKVIKKYSTKHD